MSTPLTPREKIVGSVAFLAGAAIWIGIALAASRKEAWDSPLYFAVGMPLAIALSAALAWIEPRKAWRWAVLPFAGQFIAMIAWQGLGSLWPLGLILMAVLSVPSIVAVLVVTRLRKPG